jgi:acyl carrier protein
VTIKEVNSMSTEDMRGPGDLLARVRRAYADALRLPCEDVPIEAELREAVGDRYDSLAAVECVAAVESEFGIEVDFVADDVRYWFSSVANTAEFVARRLADQATLATPR